MNAPPAFQFYASDFIGGTMHFSAEEVGAYIRLLCHQWMNGFIPEDPDKQARICGCQCDRIATALAKFPKGKDGCLRNTRLEEVRAGQQAFLAKKSAAGKAAAAKRWQPHSDGNAMAMPGQCDGNASLNSELLTPFKSSIAKSANAMAMPGQCDGNAKGDSKRTGEKEFIEDCKPVFGAKTMINWGGRWRKLYREDSDKAKRALAETIHDMRGKAIENPGGYAYDLYKNRFK